jgi:hypothetical protein
MSSASASQVDHGPIPEDQLAEMLSKMKSSRETEALRARLPAQLAPFASNISVVEPTQTVSVSATDGLYFCGCAVKERRIYMSVAVAPSPQSQSQDSDSKPLELVWRDWSTSSRGSAHSHMHSLSLQYGRPPFGRHSNVEAFTGWYCDSATSGSEYSHGRIKSVVEEVARDMGFREGKLDNQLEVIEALLGHDGRELLESHAEDRKTLRKVIEDELVEEDYE